MTREVLVQAELLQEDIVNEQQQIIHLQQVLKENDDALILLKQEATKGNKKAWMNYGNIFMRMPTDDADSSIQQEAARIRTEIETLKKGITEKTQRLSKLTSR
eukprot:TRINITY_DN10976_c0_g1_i1.p1 TRINITY_DN10976_c0_g1~~TRINITY_DN10976_c0_g1_i1.p1  ORF type:complete len:103 (+),score=28.11 TRINITY_DN10976_c0_g1_i1:22-330(+)